MRMIVEANEFGKYRRARPAPAIEARKLVQQKRCTRGLEHMVEARIMRAGPTLRLLPLPQEVRGLTRVCRTWPDLRRSFAELLEQEREARNRRERMRKPRLLPTPEQLSELDECLQWILWCDEEARPIIFAKMLGLGFRRIAAFDARGRSHEMVRKVYKHAITCISDRLIGTVPNKAK